MPAPVVVIEPGSGAALEVRERAARVTVAHVDPTPAEASRVRLFSAFLTTAAGSQDMTVDGSTTAQLFRVTADTAADPKLRAIHSIRLTIHDSQMKIDSNEIRRFGSAAAAPGLTNGLKLSVSQGGTITELFADPVQSVSDFYRYSGGPSVAAAAAIHNVVDGVAAGTDIVYVQIEIPAPVLLYPGSLDYVGITVQDDLTTITLLEAQALGTQAEFNNSP